MTYAIGQHTTAEALSGKDIGRVVQFYWEMDGSKVSAKITAELRQIAHSSSESHLNVTSHTEDAGGEMSEFTLDPTHAVTFLVKAND